jgi:hypothetical protein
MLTKEDINRISGVELEQLDGYKKVVELFGEEVDALPAGLNFLGLSLNDCPLLTQLPDDLPIQYLSVMECPNLKHLPKDLELAHLYLFDSEIEAIPEKSSCFAALVLIDCPYIKHLPAGCTAVMNDVTLDNCPNIATLPDLEIVHGEFCLRNTSVTSLPEELKIGGRLWVYDTPIETLPATIRVGGDILLNGCKKLKYLPKGLMVNGDLNLSDSALEELPKGLIVKGNLNITDTAIKTLPEDMIVGGNVIASEGMSEGLAVNHKVPGNLAELIWKDSGYIYANEQLYRIIAKEDRHWKVVSSFMNIYLIRYGHDDLIDRNILYLVPDNNPESHVYGVGNTLSEAYMDLLLRTSDSL